MSAHPATLEASFQRAVIDLAARHRWLCAHFHDSRRQVVRGGAVTWIGDAAAAGYPDLTLVRERVVYAELKSPTGRLSPAQRRWIDALVAAGQEVYVWRPEDWPEIERVLT